ncbi:glycine betaine/choline ABC-type transport system substrate-binding protein [Bradyrhizobium sp. USDA 4473]
MLPRGALLAELKKILAEQDITLLGVLGFENAYALVMPRQRAEALGIHSITDLAAHAPTLSIAGDYEFFSPGMDCPAQGLRTFIPCATTDAA